jgi:hypothetical protein
MWLPVATVCPAQLNVATGSDMTIEPDFGRPRTNAIHVGARLRVKQPAVRGINALAVAKYPMAAYNQRLNDVLINCTQESR